MPDEHSEAVRKKLSEIRSQLAELEQGSELSRLFRRVLDATDNTMTITDPNLPDNPLIYVNKEFENLTGYSYDEVVGRNCRFLQGDDRDQAGVRLLREAIAAGHNVRAELRNYRKNGEMFWNELYLTAIRDRNGKILYFFGVQNDITELKESLESERDLRESLGARMAFVALLDAEGQILRVDQSTLNDAGLCFAEVEHVALEASPWWAHAPQRRGDLRSCINRALQGETCQLDIAMQRQGQALTVELAFSPRRNARGVVDQVIVTGVDVSERKRAQAALERLNETLEDRVEARTQEVRSLASALTLAEHRERHRIAQLLHDDLQQDIFAAQYALRDLQRQVADLPGASSLDDGFDKLNEQLKEAVRAARGLTSDLSPPVLKTEGFSAALTWLARRAEDQHGLVVDLDIDDSFPDPHEALRVLLLSLIRELFLNVVKHAQTEHVQVKARRQTHNAVVDVIDEGRGFEAGQDLPTNSTGFGLYSVAERLKLFGGQLKIKSSPRKGTRVTILIPIRSFTLEP